MEKGIGSKLLQEFVSSYQVRTATTRDELMCRIKDFQGYVFPSTVTVDTDCALAMGLISQDATSAVSVEVAGHGLYALFELRDDDEIIYEYVTDDAIDGIPDTTLPPLSYMADIIDRRRIVE